MAFDGEQVMCLASILDFVCGSGSLVLNVLKQMCPQPP
jgi:hypothetical protein